MEPVALTLRTGQGPSACTEQSCDLQLRVHLQVPLHTLHTSAANWPSPERFWPERWGAEAARGGPKNGTPAEGPGAAFLPCGASCPSAKAAEVQVRFPPPFESQLRLLPGRCLAAAHSSLPRSSHFGAQQV